MVHGRRACAIRCAYHFLHVLVIRSAKCGIVNYQDACLHSDSLTRKWKTTDLFVFGKQSSLRDHLLFPLPCDVFVRVEVFKQTGPGPTQTGLETNESFPSFDPANASPTGQSREDKLCSSWDLSQAAGKRF